MSQLKIMNNEKEEKSFNTKEVFSSGRLSSCVYVCTYHMWGWGRHVLIILALILGEKVSH